MKRILYFSCVNGVLYNLSRFVIMAYQLESLKLTCPLFRFFETFSRS